MQMPNDEVDRILAMPDWVLASLYEEWSGINYAASWYLGGEPAFVDDLLSLRHVPAVEPANGGGARIRELLKEALAERELR